MSHLTSTDGCASMSRLHCGEKSLCSSREVENGMGDLGMGREEWGREVSVDAGGGVFFSPRVAVVAPPAAVRR